MRPALFHRVSFSATAIDLATAESAHTGMTGNSDYSDIAVTYKARDEVR